MNDSLAQVVGILHTERETLVRQLALVDRALGVLCEPAQASGQAAASGFAPSNEEPKEEVLRPRVTPKPVRPQSGKGHSASTPQKALIVRFAQEHSSQAASAKFGFKATTINRWRRESGEAQRPTRVPEKAPLAAVPLPVALPIATEHRHFDPDAARAAAATAAGYDD